MPCASRAAVTLPVSEGARPAASVVYEGADASRSMKNITATMPSADRPTAIFERVGSLRKDWASVGMDGYRSDLRVEEVGGRLDDLVADLRGELHGELRPLDRHHHGGRVLGGAGGELLSAGGCVLLGGGERGDGSAEQAPEGRAGAAGGAGRRARAVLRNGRWLLDQGVQPLGAADRVDGVDRHQRSSSRVLENICLAACIAVTFASYARWALIRSTISATESTFGICTSPLTSESGWPGS